MLKHDNVFLNVNSLELSRRPLSSVLITFVLMFNGYLCCFVDSLIHETWYTKYPSYPPYCSTPTAMKQRSVPPLQSMIPGTLGETRILHVTAILRHGARTPYKANLNCWENYTVPTSDTASWDCNLTTFLAPPPPERIYQEEGEGSSTNTKEDEAMFLFEKVYDSLHNDEDRMSPKYKDPNSGILQLKNELGGTCQLGQLLLQGYEQELMNGKYLRAAYIYNSYSYGKEEHDQRMRLLDSFTNGSNGTYLWDSLTYRVDDDQRTLMSGQVVLRGMFGNELVLYITKNGKFPVLTLHTADRHKDIVDPNESECTRLKEMRINHTINSVEYQILFNTSKEAQLIKEFQKEILKIPNPNMNMDAIDCLMTTICTDRILPNPVNNYNNNNTSQPNETTTTAIVDNNNIELDTKYGSNRFQQLIDYEVNQYGYNIQANNGEYSKLGMGPLWAEIMDGIYPFIDKDLSSSSTSSSDDDQNKKRTLSVIAGHDTTIMPLLVSLGQNVWDKQWAPYASMMIIEIHAINVDSLSNRTIYQSDYAFRLLYNGNVLTDKITGCYTNLELCDVQVLVRIVQEFAIRDVNCSLQQPLLVKITTYDQVMEEAETLVSNRGGIILILLLVFSNAFLGSLITYIWLHSRRNIRDQHERIHQGYTFNENGDGSEHDDDYDDNNNLHFDSEVTLSIDHPVNFRNGGGDHHQKRQPLRKTLT